MYIDKKDSGEGVEMGELINSLAKAIFDSSEDIIQDYAEITIDSVLEDGILKEVPLVGTALGVGKVVLSVRDRIFLKNIIIFLKKVKENRIDEEHLQKHLKSFENNPHNREKELEIVVSCCDQYTDRIKSKLLANIYTCFITGKIDWENFRACVEILEDIKVTDIPTLCEIYEKGEYVKGDNYYPLSLKRLNGVGVVQYFDEMVVVRSKENKRDIKAAISPSGKAFVEIAMNDIVITDEDF